MEKMLSKEELEFYGMKPLTKTELRSLQPGRYIDCDLLLQSLFHAGYNARYENLFTSPTGFFAVFYIGSRKAGAVEMAGDKHMLAYWEGLE